MIELDGCVVEVVNDSRDVAVLRFAGEIDVANAHEIQRVVVDAVTTFGQVRVDLGAVEYLDSHGLAAFVLVREPDAPPGVPLRVVSVTPAARRLIVVSGLEDLLLGDESPAMR